MPDYHAFSSHLAHYEREIARSFAAASAMEARPSIASSETRPRHCYFICFTNRSGSTLLAQALWHSARMGRPGEIFNPEPVERAAREHGLRSMREYIDWRLARAAQRGAVFGAKLGMHQLAWLAAHGELGRVFGAARYVYVTRRDLLMQAVSLYIASCTGAWSSRLETGTEVPFDAEAIARSLRALATTQAEFEAFFASHGILPLRLSYEEIEANLQRALRRVCRHVGIDQPGRVALPPVALQKQRTARNEEFAARFRELHRHAIGLV